MKSPLPNRAWLISIVGLLIAGMGFYAGRVDLQSASPTVQILDCHDRVICEIRDGGEDAEAGYWKLRVIPPRVAATVISVEDRRFYWHKGVDPIGIIRAILQNLQAGRRISGASTLAMQVARLQQPKDRTITNKLREMVDAVLMTTRFGRNRIVIHYLRIAPYGNGIRGIGYASRAYFDKPVEDLSWAEIAFLCAIPQQPNRMNPRTAAGRSRT
ncbi:transglycosylase domain-containing protein, partial [bacterium]|nr:transglycosylase domain-containing protein [candidate division CSSED10-310 bacterium]